MEHGCFKDKILKLKLQLVEWNGDNSSLGWKYVQRSKKSCQIVMKTTLKITYIFVLTF